MRKKVIAISLPYAVTIRDFLSSGALKLLVGDRDYRCIVYTMNPTLEEFESYRTLGVEFRCLKYYNDSPIEKLIKNAYIAAFSDACYNVNVKVSEKNFKSVLAYLLVTLKRCLGVKRFTSVTSKILLALYKLKSKPLQLDGKIDLIIGTRCLLYSLDYSILAEAFIKNLPVLMIAGSWDNFTTKGYFPLPVVCTAVWNQKMREDLVNIFEVKSDKVEIVGYPRAILLEKHRPQITAEEYLEQIGIKGFKRFILYSASYKDLTISSRSSMPLEYYNILNLVEALERLLPNNVCLLIRLHPFSDSADPQLFLNLKKTFVYLPGRQDKYVERVMGQFDEINLAHQIQLATCIISMASTISIDATHLNVPIINVVYDPIEDLPSWESIERFYRFNHFQSLVENVKLPLAKSISDVELFVEKCLNGVYIQQVDQKVFQDLYVPQNSKNYSNNICKVIRKHVK